MHFFFYQYAWLWYLSCIISFIVSFLISHGNVRKENISSVWKKFCGERNEIAVYGLLAFGGNAVSILGSSHVSQTDLHWQWIKCCSGRKAFLLRVAGCKTGKFLVFKKSFVWTFQLFVNCLSSFLLRCFLSQPAQFRFSGISLKKHNFWAAEMLDFWNNMINKEWQFQFTTKVDLHLSLFHFGENQTFALLFLLSIFFFFFYPFTSQH